MSIHVYIWYISPLHSNGFSSAKFLFPSLIEFSNDFLSFLTYKKIVEMNTFLVCATNPIQRRNN